MANIQLTNFIFLFQMMVFWAFPPHNFHSGGMNSLQLQGDRIWFIQIAMTGRRNCIDYTRVSTVMTYVSYTEEAEYGTCTKSIDDDC